MRIVEIRTLPTSRYGAVDVLLEGGQRLENVRSVEWLNRCGELQVVRLEIIFKEQPTIAINAQPQEGEI